MQIFNLSASEIHESNASATVRLFSQKGNADIYARKYKKWEDYYVTSDSLEKDFLTRSTSTDEKLEEINFTPDCAQDHSDCLYIVYVVCMSDTPCEYLLELTTGEPRSAEDLVENAAH